MDLRKRLVEKIREQQYPLPGYSPAQRMLQRQASVPVNGASPPGGSPPAAGSPAAPNEMVWKMVENCRDQLQSLMTDGRLYSGSPSPFQRDYVSRWNSAVWPLLDTAVLLNTTLGWHTGPEHALRVEMQQLLGLADDTSPVSRYCPSEPTSLLHQHYTAAAEHLAQLANVIQTGNATEEQIMFYLRQYRNIAAIFTSRVIPHILDCEAIRVRSLEQHRHACSPDSHQPTASRGPSPSTDGSASSRPFISKISDTLNEFRSLLDWCFALVGTLLANTIGMLNRMLLIPECNRYITVVRNELQGMIPSAVLALCKFVLWISTQPPMIMVTKTEFTCHSVLLNNYFAHDDQLRMQIVSEATARDIQDKCHLKHASLVSPTTDHTFQSAGVLVMKKMDSYSLLPSTPTLNLRRRLSTCGKRRRRSHQPASTPGSAVPSPPSTAFASVEDEDAFVFVNGANRQDEGNTQNGAFIHQNPFLPDRLDVAWRFDQNSRLVLAEAEQACCTDRNLTTESSTNTGSNGQVTSGDRQRDIYYMHCWTRMAIFGVWYDLHTLSLPFVIPTRKNQDLQLHRMLKSYSATIFWLHVAGKPDGFLIDWDDSMGWTQFSNALNIYFMREARVTRGLSDFDFMLLKEKAKCADCGSDTNVDKLSYQNIICPHLFYQCGDRPLLKHSLWRVLLDLIQLFQNDRTKVRELWERGVLGGLWSMDSVSKILVRHARPVLMARISLLAGGSILLSFSTSIDPTSVIHTEPLDQQHLNRRNLIDCIADIGESEGIDYLLDSNFQPVPIATLIQPESANAFKPILSVRANSDQLGCPNAHRQYTFHTLKLSMVPSRMGENGRRRIVETNRVKAEPAMSIGTNGNEMANLENELKNLMLRHGCSSGDVLSACQKLVSVNAAGLRVQC